MWPPRSTLTHSLNRSLNRSRQGSPFGNLTVNFCIFLLSHLWKSGSALIYYTLGNRLLLYVNSESSNTFKLFRKTIHSDRSGMVLLPIRKTADSFLAADTSNLWKSFLFLKAGPNRPCYEIKWIFKCIFHIFKVKSCWCWYFVSLSCKYPYILYTLCICLVSINKNFIQFSYMEHVRGLVKWFTGLSLRHVSFKRFTCTFCYWFLHDSYGDKVNEKCRFVIDVLLNAVVGFSCWRNRWRNDYA